MKKLFSCMAVMALVLGMGGITRARSFVSLPDGGTGDQLNKIYSELRVGMTLAEVRDLAEKHYPNLKLEDTDIWGRFDSNLLPYFSWVIGAGEKRRINVHSKSGDGIAYVSRLFLRTDFDDKSKLINAVYIRSGKKGFKEGKSIVEEHKALVGDGYYR